MPLLIAMTAIGPVTLNIVVPALPGIITRLDTNAAAVQLTLSLFLLSLACAQLVLGPLSDRFGRRPVALAGLALAVAASLGAIAASSIGALIAARIFQAAGASTGIVIGRAIIRDLYDRDRAAGMIGLVTTAMVIAPMVSPLIGGILDTAFGWEAIFIFITLMCGAVLAWAALTLPETHHTRVSSSPAALLREWRALLVNARFHAYVLAGALGSAPFFIFIGGGPHVVITLMGRSSAEYGVWFALSSFGYMAGNFSVSRLAHRVGLDAMIMAGIALGLAGAALMAVLFTVFPQGGPVTVFLPQFIISYGNGLLLPNAVAGAVSIRPEAAGAAAGLTGFAQMATGAAATQTISALFAGSSGAMPMAWMMFAVLAVCAVAFRVLVRR
ncbi:multidrug effflux MFS transporter [Pseudolabrys sp. FHR47]|uniref:multidrug effflux MFS transporter n=1 Tax=Pseudolabrys sp. FHR47 TaxID=2562284 RepID=UPI00143CD907|nr:multidrug effflux MFS transporter [Pseudolabrys sp. FHR47]